MESPENFNIIIMSVFDFAQPSIGYHTFCRVGLLNCNKHSKGQSSTRHGGQARALTDLGRHIERSRNVTIKSVNVKSIVIQLKLFIL